MLAPREWDRCREHTPPLRKDDTEDIAKCREGYKNRECSFRLWTEDVPEEGSGKNAARSQNLFLRHRREVRDLDSGMSQLGHSHARTRFSYIDQHIQNGHSTQSKRSRNFQGPHRISRFTQGVIGIAVANVAPDHVVQGCHNPVCATSGTLECVVEIMGFVNLTCASKSSSS